jgi:hypothetical protein
MAATDIQYGDFSPVLNTVDFSFLRYVLDKKSNQYEQGLKSVSSSYNALKRDVSDPVNAQRRDQYIKNAQGELQKIAATDLSLQENVNSANNVFQPMATDKAFLIDSYYTAANKKEMAEMDSWRNSDDMETRKKFNPLIYSWLQSDLDSLKSGKGDVNNYKVQGRKAFAAVDAQDILNKAVKDSGFTVSQDIDGGTYVYGVEGGKEFKQNYKTFADQVLKANSVYMQQNQILGEATHENIIKQGKASGLTDEQALSQYADNTYTTNKTNRETYINGVKDDLTKQSKDLIAEANGVDGSTPEGQAKLADIAQRTKKLEEDGKQLTVIKTDYESQYGGDTKTAEEKKAAYLKNFLANPKGFFSNNYFDSDINTFSNIKSQSVKSTIKPNTAYFNAFNAANDAQKTESAIRTAQQNIEIKQDAQDLKEQHETWLENGKPVAGKTFSGSTGGAGSLETVTTINPDGTITSSKQAKKPQLTYVGPSGVDINKTTNTLNAISGKLNDNMASSLSNLATAPNGGAVSLLNTMGVGRENVQILRGYFAKQQEQLIKDPSSHYKPTNTEAKALQDAYSSMFAFAKQNKDETTLKKLRAEYGKDVRNIDFHGILDMAISNTVFKDKKDWEYVRQWNEHKKDNENIIKLGNILSAGKKATIAYYLNNPDFSNIIIKDKNGKPDLIGEENIYNTLKNYKYFSVAGTGFFNDDTVTLPDDVKRKIAKGYIDGSVKVDIERGHYDTGPSAQWIPGKASMDVDGKRYYFKMGSTDTMPFPMSSDKFQKRMNQLNSEVVLPDIDPSLKQELTASPIWNANGALKNTILTSLAPVTQFSSNIKMSDGSYGYTQVDDADLQKQIRGALADPKNVAENGVYIHSSSASNNGGLSVAVTFAEGTEKEKKAGTCKYCGQTYYFPIDVVKGTPEVLQAFNTVNDQTEYNNIKNSGKTYDLYDYTKMGIKVQMLPHTAGSDTGDIVFTVQKQDPVTHQYIPGQYETITDHYDLSNITFSELKDQIYNQTIDPYIMTRIDYNKAQAATTGVAGGLTKDNVLNKLKGLTFQ